MEVKKKYKRPQLEVKCFTCGVSFEKDGSEVRRNEKIGRSNYCSLKCLGKNNHKHLKKGDVSNFKGKIGRQHDKYTGFREYLNRVKNKRNKEYDISLDDLITQWDKQKGKCIYTGIKLIHPRNAKNEVLYNKSSLDRIDSDKGYIKENIQFISASANHAKNNMSHEQMIDFCKIITEQWRDS